MCDFLVSSGGGKRLAPRLHIGGWKDGWMDQERKVLRAGVKLGVGNSIFDRSVIVTHEWDFDYLCESEIDVVGGVFVELRNGREERKKEGVMGW